MFSLPSLASRKPLFTVSVISIALLLAATISQPVESAATQERAKKPRRYPNLDVRVTDPQTMSNIARTNASNITQRLQARKTAVENAIARLKTFSRGAHAKSSPLTGAVEVLRSTTGALTAPAPGRNGEDIVRGFIRNNSDLYGLSPNDIAGLRISGESVSGGSGMRMVRVEQTVNGRPVFQSDTRFILDGEGRVIRSTGLIVPDTSAVSPDFARLISAQAALGVAMKSVDIEIETSQATIANRNADGTEVEIVSKNANIAGSVTSKLVYFPLAPGILVPAWSQVTFTKGVGDWYTLVDARSGKLLWRKNIRNDASNHNARFRVYVQADGTTPADSPAPLSPTTATTGSNTQPAGISPTIVSMFTAQSLTASPNGWIDDCSAGGCTAAQTQTIGNNVHAYLDRDSFGNTPDFEPSSVIDGGGKPMGNPDVNGRNRDFLGTSPRNFETSYLPPPQAGNPESGQTASGDGNNGTTAVDQFRRGVLTQMFYVTNWYHDKLFLLGFDEAAGNFQQTNFGGQGSGNDRVLAEAQDDSGFNNAFFSTPPDGQSGRAVMYIFDGPTVDRDGALDSEVLIHELTHGVTSRILGNASGLVWDPGAALSEGWSDFFTLALLNNTSADSPSGKYAVGAYSTYKYHLISSYTDNYLYGIRRFPYSTSSSINPLTWADADDYTNNLSGGITPDPLGNNQAGAAEAHNAGEIWALTLWEVRSRIITANGGSVPTGNQIMLQLVTDALKMTPINPSYIDARDALIDADCATNACANEQSIWNGFATRGLGYGARVSTSYGLAPLVSHQGIAESFATPGLDVQTVAVNDSLGNNNGAIDPGEPIRITVTLTNPWRSTSKNVSSATATLTTSTSGITIMDGSSTYGAIPAQGSASGDSFQINVPLTVSCGQSLKFTITSNSSLGARAVNFQMRVGAPNGTGAPVTYTRTPSVPLPIQDLYPRGTIDSLTINDDFEIADLDFRVDRISHTFPADLTVGFRAPNGYGVDLISFIGFNVGAGHGPDVVDMVIDNQATGDLLQAEEPPYSGSWLPVANSPSWPSPEPVGELNKINGASTQGTWQVLVSDQQFLDEGTLDSWSLIVTPTAFACTPFLSATAGELIISEFRLRGLNGSRDEFIEIYNNSGANHTVVASAGTGYAVAASDGVTRCVIPNGTVIPDRGHYLCTNSAAYSLSTYATGNATYTTDIFDNAGIALFNTSVTANFSLNTRLDAVGSTTESNTLYKEGTGYPALTAFSNNYAMVRDECGKQGSISNFADCPSDGEYVDNNNNSVDFFYVATNGANAGAGQRLGAPGPQNLASPIARNAVITHSLLDATVSGSNPPNRVRNTTSDSANNSTFGTLDTRRRVTNNSGGPITRLRYRILDVTTFPAPSGIADLRGRTSTSILVSGINDPATCLASNGSASTPCTVTVRGTTLEQPPTQSNGGAFNSTLSVGTITLSQPLANGASVNVRFLFGVQQTGSFRFLLNVEVLP
ncbi:MAG TPA: M36 family metallopeptidase [Pyrinomonadaceae bacterium]|nr:M36 family metallopeptidase [Pyrinomonadaceae bacterium]